MTLVVLVGLSSACSERERELAEPSSDPPVSATGEAADDPAWWLGVEFPPESPRAGEFEIADIEPAWRRAHTLTLQDLQERLPAAAVAEFLESQLSFEVERDLNEDRESERAFVGTFERQDGETGRFLVISRGDRVVARFIDVGLPGFSALVVADDTLRWYKCLQCGDYDAVVPSGSSFALE